MSKVAIAGGLVGLGMAVVDSLRISKHEYVILSRKPSDDPEVVAVDYSDVQGLRETLEKHDIHTVISTIGLYTPARHQCQMNLIEAAYLATSTKRFVPSEFGFHARKELETMSILFPFKLEAAERLEESGLEFTLINTGVFLDYFVWPRVPSHVNVSTTWIHLAGRLAAIPGDGNQPAAFTHTRDIGRFVVALLDLGKWEKRYCAIGDQMTLNEVVKVAEELTGTVFEKVYDSEVELARGRCTLLPDTSSGEETNNPISQQPVMELLSAAGLFIAKGFAASDPTTSISNTFPDLKPYTVRSAIKEWVERGSR